MSITFTTYCHVNGLTKESDAWCCHVLENGSSTLLFFGATENEALDKASEFAATQLNRPEIVTRIRQRIEAAKRTVKKIRR
jgi:hypothetical protein